MFILMGEAEKLFPLKKGKFFCTMCKQDNDYTHHYSVNYFTVFGIKVAQLETLSDYITCDRCTSCFSPKAITSPELHQQAVEHYVLFRVLCYLLSGYGNTTDARNQLLSIFKEITNQSVTAQMIDNELKLIETGNVPTLPFLKAHTHLLSPLKKHMLIITSFNFANNICLMEHHDRVRINTIGSSLGLSLPEIEYLIVNNQ